MSPAPRKSKPRCFVVSPIGEDKSAVREAADQVLRHLIAPAVRGRYVPKRADELGRPGLIPSAIIRHIADDDLVVADLTGANPNVYYELALRHVARKPCIQIAQEGTLLPFDVQPVNTIFYNLTNPDSLKRALGELKHQVKLISEGEPVENPVTAALGGAPAMPSANAYGWDSLAPLVVKLSRQIAARWEPDLVLTMSGPGSIAAFLRLSLDHRDAPVVAATTFPVDSSPGAFEQAAIDASYLRFYTGKWRIFVPPVLAHLPPASRVLLFDDRVVSGRSQAALADWLAERGVEVRRAALVVSSESAPATDWYCHVRDDEYSFPWGDQDGRARR